MEWNSRGSNPDFKFPNFITRPCGQVMNGCHDLCKCAYRPKLKAQGDVFESLKIDSGNEPCVGRPTLEFPYACSTAQQDSALKILANT